MKTELEMALKLQSKNKIIDDFQYGDMTQLEIIFNQDSVVKKTQLYTWMDEKMIFK